MKALFAAMLLAACSERAPTDEEVQSSLAGTRWRIDELHGRAINAERDLCPVTLVFGLDGTFAGTGVVNDYAAHYRVADGLVRSDGIAANLAGAVDEELNLREHALFAVLGSPFALRQSGNGAEMVDATGRIQLRLRRHQGIACAQGR